MKAIVWLLVLAVVHRQAAATVVKGCNSGSLPRSVSIKGCEKPPCRLVRGRDAEVVVQFATVSATNGLSPKILATVAGFSLPFELPKDQNDGCKHLTGTRCPVDAGEDAIYTLTMPVNRSYPPINLEIELKLMSDKNEPQFCFKVDCQVVSA